MTEKENRLKVANVARSYLGAKERDGSHQPIIDLYNTIRPLPRGYKMKYADPWCAAFVSVVALNCGFLNIMPAECGCGPMIELYKKLGCWEENDAYKAQPGDVIFYDWEDSGSGDNVGGADHVGIVVEVSGNIMTIVEGNKSDSVSLRKLNYNAKNIRGFGLPDYSKVSDDVSEIPIEDGTTLPLERKTFAINLPELQYGDGLNNPDQVVKTAQILLIGRKFPCGSAGDDGEFGSGTREGVRNFQLANGLEVTGKIDEQTWLRLHGLK